MSKNFGTIKTNVGTRVGDTSTTFATTIGSYVNDRYRDILKRTNFDCIDDDYTISVSAGTKDYVLPSDFGKELYVWDSTNKLDIPYLPFQDIERLFSSQVSDSGQVSYYTIFSYMSTDATPVRKKKLRVFLNAASAITLAVPYIISPSDLSASTDELIVDFELGVEYGATADAWATKRQIGKASYFESLYEKQINTIIWNKANQPNQIVQFMPKTYNQDQLY